MREILLAWKPYHYPHSHHPLRTILAIAFLAFLIAFEVGAQEKTLSQESAVSPWLDESAAYFTTGPDIILYNANVITMDDQLPAAEAIAIEGNLISAVGTDTDVLALQAAHTVLYDLEGRTIVPGLIDAHGHRLLHAFWDGGPEGLVRATEATAADGYTTVHELYGDEGFIRQAQVLAQEGRLAVRINAFIPYNTNCGEDNDPWMTFPYTEKKDTTLRVVGVKIFADGGSCFCAAITSVWQGWAADICGEHGQLFRTQEEMNAIVDTVLAYGYPIAMHVLGDSAVGVGLNAFEHVFAGGSNALRSRMEHLRVMREDLADQMAALGIGASIQYTWANALTASRWEAAYLPEVLGWVYPWRRMADRGIPIIGGNDFPSTSRSQAMQTISWLATRKAYADDIVPDWMVGDELTVEEGLRAMTVTNTWNVFEEDVKGTIAPSKLADLTILSGDPLTIDPFDVRDITIEMTIMDGIIRHNQMDVAHTAIHDAGAFSMGFDDRGLWGPYRSNVGLVYNGSDYLYMGSLLVSYNEGIVATATPPQADYATSFEGWVDFQEPGTNADEEATVVYEDAAVWHPGRVRITQRTYMWEGDPLLLVKYTFMNIGESPLSNIYFGQFMDFDIVDWAGNMGGWDSNQGLGFAYMYNVSDPNTPYIGIAMFDSSGKHTNSALAFTTGLYPNSEYEFSNWMRSDNIESATPDPRDYSILIASQPCNLPVGYSKAPFILAFAVGESLEDLKSAVNQAYQRYAGLLDIDTRQDQITPAAYVLHPAYPNPFNPVTTIGYSLPIRGKVVLSVYNLLGEEIARLVEGERSVGYHQVTWDASDMASGIYLFRLSAGPPAGGFVLTKKMVLLK